MTDDEKRWQLYRTFKMYDDQECEVHLALDLENSGVQACTSYVVGKQHIRVNQLFFFMTLAQNGVYATVVDFITGIQEIYKQTARGL